MAGNGIDQVEWPVEEIPDRDRIFMRVHKTAILGGDLKPNAFRDHGGGMSTDWERYATPEETRGRGRIPADNAVIEMGVGDVRAIDPLQVVHEPLQQNRAHTEVFGEKDVEVRVKLRRVARWRITLDQ